jgi:(p)ppGpp synthase/HD superfamily hydrolase
MPLWNQDTYIKAWNFACIAHNGQCVPGSDLPYINHIGNVTMEVMAVIALGDEMTHPELLIQCALLHDVIEDTHVSYEELSHIFGPHVADGVRALSKDPSLKTKEERMNDSLRRIKKQPKEIWMIKVADRITNLQPPPTYWTQEKIKRYWKESRVIYQNLKESNVRLAQRLNEKIGNYCQYF